MNHGKSDSSIWFLNIWLAHNPIGVPRVMDIKFPQTVLFLDVFEISANTGKIVKRYEVIVFCFYFCEITICGDVMQPHIFEQGLRFNWMVM